MKFIKRLIIVLLILAALAISIAIGVANQTPVVLSLLVVNLPEMPLGLLSFLLFLFGWFFGYIYKYFLVIISVFKKS